MTVSLVPPLVILTLCFVGCPCVAGWSWQWQTHFTMGVFLGLCTMLTQLYLTLFALFVSFSQQSGLDGDGLVAAFSFLLFLLFVSPAAIKHSLLEWMDLLLLLTACLTSRPPMSTCFVGSQGVFTIVLLKNRNDIVTEELPLPPMDTQGVNVNDVRVEGIDKAVGGEGGEIQPVNI